MKFNVATEGTEKINEPRITTSVRSVSSVAKIIKHETV